MCCADVFLCYNVHIETYEFISLINSGRVFTSQSILSNDFCKQMNMCVVYVCGVLAHDITEQKENKALRSAAIVLCFRDMDCEPASFPFFS